MSNKPMASKFKYITCWIFVCISIYLYLFVFIHGSLAQDISLSISPPLLEIMIQPGKEVDQTVSFFNSGSDALIKAKMVYFRPSDIYGNIQLTDDSAPDWIVYDKEETLVKKDSRVDYQIKFKPTNDESERDHFLTIIFETKPPNDILGQNSTRLTSQIGSNILLTVSNDGNPKKSAEIIEFSAPKIVDSFFSNIRYKVVISNTGNSYWKPIGKISTQNEQLTLAPQNILSANTREIFCLNSEELIECSLNKKILAGKINSYLEFNIEDDLKTYKSESQTIVFPFILTFVLLVLTLIYKRFIFKLWAKRK